MHYVQNINYQQQGNKVFLSYFLERKHIHIPIPNYTKRFLSPLGCVSVYNIHPQTLSILSTNTSVYPVSSCTEGKWLRIKNFGCKGKT